MSRGLIVLLDKTTLNCFGVRNMFRWKVVAPIRQSHASHSVPPEMSLLTLALIGATIVVSSFLSGVFGLAGGMVLLGVLLVFLDVTPGMVLFSVIQFFANAWRALQWWEFVRWRIFWFYCLGGAVAFGMMGLIAFIPDKALVYLLLGLMPFLVELIPARARPNIEWRGVPFLTGVLP